MGVLYLSYLTNVVATPVWGLTQVAPKRHLKKAHSAAATVPNFVTWITRDLIL
jgi:hypothetical protein